jgi:integrase
MSPKKLPSGITQRGSKYRVNIMLGGHRYTATKDTLQDAITYADGVRDGTFLSDNLPTTAFKLEEALNLYRDQRLIATGKKEGSIRGHNSKGQQLINYFGADHILQDIVYSQMVEYMTEATQQRGVSPDTANSELSCLRYTMVHAQLMEHFRGELPKFPKTGQKKRRIRFLTDNEEEKMLKYLNHIGDTDTRDAFIVLMDTGLRVNVDFLDRKWEDFHLKERRIHIWGSKSATPRAVPMTKRVYAILKDKKVTHGDQRGPFSHRTYMNLRDHWQHVREVLNMGDDPHFVIHMLRHTFCTRLVSAGIDLKTVQVMAGHENINTTMQYAHFVPTKAFEVVDALENRNKGE